MDQAPYMAAALAAPPTVSVSASLRPAVVAAATEESAAASPIALAASLGTSATVEAAANVRHLTLSPEKHSPRASFAQ